MSTQRADYFNRAMLGRAIFPEKQEAPLSGEADSTNHRVETNCLWRDRIRVRALFLVGPSLAAETEGRG
jgi:hypothetical protein